MRLCPGCYAKIDDDAAATCNCGQPLTTFDASKTYHAADTTEQIYAAVAMVKRYGRTVQFIGTIHFINMFGRPETVWAVGPVDYGGTS